ncbi:radical SAM protein [Tissierella sp.]|uniref:radical SAM/SPASM domain-containing protein n=1 Tax=Tissierella sp. TaxID=41274 RepID=UPI00305B9375
MYFLTLELINACNMTCKYCYLGSKKNKLMSKNTIERSIDICINEAVKQYDKKLDVCLIGGEPLMAYDNMVYTVDLTNRKCEEKGISVFYNTITNGTLLNKEMMDFFIKERFDLKISLDGSESVHNLNRFYNDGSGSYSDVVDKLDLIRDYEKATGKKCSVASVITKNNVDKLKDTIIHIHDLGFKILESGINIYDDWDTSYVEILKEQINLAFDYYVTKKMEGDSFYWFFIEKKLRNYFTDVEFYGCKAGLYSSYINVDGQIYTCKEVENRDYLIGTEDKGLYPNKIRNLIRKQSIYNECTNCSYLSHCSARGCIIENFEINGDIYKPVKIKCLETKIIFDIFKNKISKEQKESFQKFYERMSSNV